MNVKTGRIANFDEKIKNIASIERSQALPPDSRFHSASETSTNVLPKYHTIAGYSFSL